MNTAAAIYKDAQARIAAARSEAKKLAREAFEAGAAELFRNHPKLESVSWTQYTPYFCDGEPCYFGVQSDGNSLEVNEYDGYSLERGRVSGLDDAERLALVAARDAASEFLQVFSDDDMQDMFDDHVQVTMSRQADGTVKTETEEYEHD